MFDSLIGVVKFILKFVVICAVISVFLLIFFRIVLRLPDGVQYIVAIAAAITIVVLGLAWISKH